MASRTRPFILCTSAAVAFRSTDSSPMTFWRTAMCPTRPPALMPSLAFQRVEILAVGVPAPGHSLLQRETGNRLHPHEALDQGVLAAVVHGRKGQAAVPHDHGSDAVLGFGGAVGVPKDLCIHVGVVIDESRSHDQAGGVDGAARRSLETAYLGDLAILHPDVRRVGRQS